MKRFLAIITIIAIIISVFSVSLNAQGTVYEYYKSQLNADEQKMYDAFITAAKSPAGESAVPTLSTIEYIFNASITTQQQLNDFVNNDPNCKASISKLNLYFKNAINAVTMDHPELYWLDNSQIGSIHYGYTSNGSTVSIIDILVNIPESVRQSNATQSINQVNAKLQSIGATGSDVNKIKKIHDWLCNKIEYISTNHSHDLYGALFNGKAVCQGYAEAFKAACDYYGVKCVCVEGDAVNSKGKREAHMWNYVSINNKWYAIDVTWDDQGEYIYYDYFLAGKNTIASHYDNEKFSSSHISNGQFGGAGYKTFSYPTLSSDGYQLNFEKPTPTPTVKPTVKPTVVATQKPTLAPTETDAPNVTETPVVTETPTIEPTQQLELTPTPENSGAVGTTDQVETTPQTENESPTPSAENMPPLTTPPANNVENDGISLAIILSCAGIGVVILAAVIVIIIRKKR